MAYFSNSVLSQITKLHFSFQPWGSEAIDKMTLSYLVNLDTPEYVKPTPLVMQVRPHLLFKPDMMTGSTPPDPSAHYQLLDRVVNVSQRYLVPIGLRGTVIGLVKQGLEVLFDEGFNGALPIKGFPKSPNRIYHLPVWATINLTHGIRLNTEREKQGEPLMKRKRTESNCTAADPGSFTTTSTLAPKKTKMADEKVQQMAPVETFNPFKQDEQSTSDVSLE